MGYGKSIYECVYNKLSEKRKKALYEANQRKNKLYARSKRAKQIESLLSSTAIQAAKSILSDGNAKLKLEKLRKNNLLLQEELKNILKEFGFPENYIDVQYDCKLCNDQGYVDGKMCTCMKQMLRNEAYNRLNCISALSLSSFETFSLDYYSSEPIGKGLPSPQKRMNDILRFCKNYADNFSKESKSLIMQGATGLGKTHLSLSIAKCAIDKGYGVIYISTPNIVSKLEKERFRYSNEITQEDTEALLCECDLLILDDLGTEFSTSFSNATIYNLINSRIMLNKPTIINTNLSMRELEKGYSERLVSRIIGDMVRLEFLGNDVRHQKTLNKIRKSKIHFDN